MRVANLREYKNGSSLRFVISATAVGMLIVVSVFYWTAKKTSKLAPTTPPLIVQTQKGAVTPGVPKELILEPATEIQGGYTMKYSTGSDLYSVSWTSTRSMDDLLSLYKTYFKDHDWTIMNESTSGNFSRGIAAMNTQGNAVVSIINNGDTRTVSLSYMKR